MERLHYHDAARQNKIMKVVYMEKPTQKLPLQIDDIMK